VYGQVVVISGKENIINCFTLLVSQLIMVLVSGRCAPMTEGARGRRRTDEDDPS
jgi:hypothetical protein